MEELQKLNKRISNDKSFRSWMLRRLEGYIEYRVRERGIEVRYIGQKCTNQRCSRWGTTLKQNQKNQYFECQDCGYEVDSNYNAAKNIGMEVIFSGQMSRSRDG
ncbi:MAG: IS605 OrfB-like transposable element containing RNAse H-like and Zn finger domain [Candidatus Methanohalarchaeum thermophilum]|uniref:IS605 OrfB-like transposable element containing RNAse H-like and Zn finger domain n=1 Tax=Methanohalarchaeum thermophilum TaxID=1903181 RepID=A0A1Q6DV75_METT1|nr:MAG: IS605 OrfB-like transposable element containing RNAse H-like and Zn finger domain [Candidatus Methanohalarchaeum thermophilum]